MKFWKGNRTEAEFEAEPKDVAAKFVEWFREQPTHYRFGMRLDRSLRSWLTSPEGFNSVWLDEAGYDEIWDTAYDLIYGSSVGA